MVQVTVDKLEASALTNATVDTFEKLFKVVVFFFNVVVTVAIVTVVAVDAVSVVVANVSHYSCCCHLSCGH